jgi:U3 small nucleolar RNA-associated protein 19
MPGTMSEGKLKRKRKVVKEDGLKKRARANSTDESDRHTEILLLENEILESRKNYNNITTLIGIAQKSDEDNEREVVACVALCRVFIRLLSAGTLTRKKSQVEKELVVTLWLRDRFSEYRQALLTILSREETSRTALALLMRCLQAEGKHLDEKEEYTFPKDSLQDILGVLVRSTSQDARKDFVENFVEQYDDIRFFALKSLRYVLLTRACCCHTRSNS